MELSFAVRRSWNSSSCRAFSRYYQDEVAIFSIDPIELMDGSLPRRSFEIVRPFTLRVAFEDGTEQMINFFPILAGELYGPLRNPDLFNRVHLDPEVHTLVWPNGADFDPSTLHDWPENETAFIEMARKWDPVGA